MLFIARSLKRITRSSSSLFLLAFLFLIVPAMTYAATLNVSPKSGTYHVGETFSVAVSTSSPAAMNAASGTLNFSTNTMQLLSVSKAASIFSFWVQEPSFSNQAGTASFEGVVLPPGFTGNLGKLITYTFKVKKVGTGTVKLTNGTVLADDGNGTELFTGANSGTYTFTPAVVATPVAPVVATTAPVAPALQVQEIPRDDLTNPVASFFITVANTKQVFKNYQLRIDEGAPIAWQDTVGNGVYTAPALPVGPHVLLVQTLDNNQNLTGYADFVISVLPQPEIKNYTKLATADEPIVVYGTAQIGDGLTVAYKKDGKIVDQENVPVNSDGSFASIVTGKLAIGTYTIDVYVQNASGARSAPITGLRTRIVSDYYLKLGPWILEGYALIGVVGGILLLLILLLLLALFSKKKNT